MFLKPEGVEQLFSETLFLELAPMMYNGSKSISFSFPPNVVAGSQRAHVALVGTSTVCLLGRGLGVVWGCVCILGKGQIEFFFLRDVHECLATRGWKLTP